LLEERLLAPDERTLNLERFEASALDSFARVEAAVGAFPFLAATRVVVVRGAHALRVAERRALWEVAQRVPEGNVLILEDLQSPTKKTKPETFGQLAGRAALRIDTTANEDVRERFVRETLEALGASAEPAAIAALARGDADLTAVRTDLEKLAIGGKTISLAELMSESLITSEAKAYQYASALVEGRSSDALAIAFELFANDPRGAGIPLLSALATEYQALWELARPGGELPARLRWRERALRPIARRMGERRARAGYERAVRGFEAIVTGRAEDPRAVVESVTALAGGSNRPAGGAAED
jgi:hypothetical protein